jgi:uncharacterized protein
MRVVLDTNILVSATFWEGFPHEILKLAEARKITLAASQATLNELFGVFARKKFDRYFQEAQTSREEVSEHILSLVEVFSPTEEISVIEQDPSDNKFLACALAAEASFIISGDRHLLHLKKFRDIPIVTSSQFLAQAKKKKIRKNTSRR